MKSENNNELDFTDISQLKDMFNDDDFSFDDDEVNKIYDANLLQLFKNMETQKTPSIKEEVVTKEQSNCKSDNSRPKEYYIPLPNNDKYKSLFYELGIYLNESKNHYLSLDEFIKYMNYIIKGDKKKKIPKDVVKVAYSVFQSYFHLPNLSRTEKRNKAKLFEKMHKISKIIMFCYDKKPELFLRPVILYMKTYKKPYSKKHSSS
ncbi:hypothetical protein M9Y10_026635 [Tritrichomonas musculus]|uniref:EF-hand domain-containing protein n=1 Tax=Tritrichomonas musculus TaxID=1915356 RepID=A0ABR2H7I6_9EUKA